MLLLLLQLQNSLQHFTYLGWWRQDLWPEAVCLWNQSSMRAQRTHSQIHTTFKPHRINAVLAPRTREEKKANKLGCVSSSQLALVLPQAYVCEIAK